MPREMPLGDPANLETEWVEVDEYLCQHCGDVFPTAESRNRHEHFVCTFSPDPPDKEE